MEADISHLKPQIRHYLERLPNWPGALFVESFTLIHPKTSALKSECESYSFQPLPTCTKKVFTLFLQAEKMEVENGFSTLHALAAKTFYLLCIPGFILSRSADFVLGIGSAILYAPSFFDRRFAVFAIRHLPIHFLAADISKIAAAFFSFPPKDPKEIF